MRRRPRRRRGEVEVRSDRPERSLPSWRRGNRIDGQRPAACLPRHQPAVARLQETAGLQPTQDRARRASQMSRNPRRGCRQIPRDVSAAQPPRDDQRIADRQIKASASGQRASRRPHRSGPGPVRADVDDLADNVALSRHRPRPHQRSCAATLPITPRSVNHVAVQHGPAVPRRTSVAGGTNATAR